MSTNIALQLSYDSSFIDFVVHKNDDEDQDKITSVDLKLSLLSNGNSYSMNEDINDTNFDALRDYLLPWKWMGTDRPTDIRICKVINDVVTNPLEFIDVKIEAPQTVNSGDFSMIHSYFAESLVSQLQTPDHIKLVINHKEAKVVDVDENYTGNTIENKSQAVISQMAQKFTPFNENLGFLFLVNQKLEADHELQFFNPSKDKKISFVCFPVTPQNDQSIWYPKTNAVHMSNGNYSIEYHIPDLLNPNNISCKAYTKATEYPKDNFEMGNVILREKEKFAGKVKIEVEQDNDWKIGFTDVLTNLLDIRDFIFDDFIQRKVEEDQMRDFLSDASEIKTYLLAPFASLKYCISAIKQAYTTTTLIKNNTANETELKGILEKIEDQFKGFETNIESYEHPQKEELLEVIFKLVLSDSPLGNIELNKNNTINKLFKLFQGLSDLGIQQILISVLLQFRFDVLQGIIGNEEKYFFRIDENTISLFKMEKKPENGKEIEVEIEKGHCAKFDIPSLEIYNVFFRYLLQNALTSTGTGLLTYLIKDTSSFNTSLIANTIPELIDTIYNDKQGTEKTALHFPKAGEKVLDIKLNTMAENTLINYLKNEINRLTAEPQTPSIDQLPIRIQIGKPDQLAPKKEDETDDVADELSGYVLLSTRSTAINDGNNFENWKYHNWARAKLSTGDNKLNTSFLVPSYLPEQNEVQQLFLEISNESASLVANLEGLSQKDFSAEGGEKNQAPSIDFLLPDNDYENNPYALRYGHYYNFAAFAVMNSGVLPEPLRDGDVLNQFKKDISGDVSDFTKTFHFLRTKSVSPPSVIIKDPDDKTTHYPKDYPKELNPLYHELFGVNEDESDKEDKKHINLKAPIILGKEFNKEFYIKIKKPRTDFWDCYSFDWAEFNERNTKPNKYKVRDEIKKIEEFLDPSVAGSFRVEIEILEDQVSPLSIGTVQSQTVKYNKDHEIKLNFKWGTEDSFINNTVTLSQGKIYKISFFNLIDEKYFEKDHHENPSGKCRFDLKRNFIPDREAQERNGFVEVVENEGTPDERSINCYKVSGEYLIFETAYQNTNSDDLNKELWKALSFNEKLVSETMQLSDSVKLVLNSKKYKSYSRIKVQHQKLDWQGRQPNINLATLGSDLNPNTDIIGENDTLIITKAMKLDAWWNSERPHNTSVISYAKILASRQGKDNLLHEYKNILDNHAMLLKYTITLYNRYESLGSPYIKDMITSEIKLDNKQGANKNGTFYPWKFYLKKSRREERLPAPSVRFYIPLTGSIKEANDTSQLNIADVMLVMDDVWYREAGLAQKFTLGIKNTAYKITSESGDLLELKQYPEAGFDVTLSEAVTKPHDVIRKKENAPAIITDKIEDFIVVENEHIKGPLGFTFDFVATNPKVNSTSFVISGNGLASNIGDGYKAKDDPFYPMFKLAVRSEISSELHTVNEHPTFSQEEKEKIVGEMTSKWSGAQWVQFLKAVDSFVPDHWRNDVRKNGFVDISNQPSLEDFKLLGEVFLLHHNVYVILSTIESNIGGLPVERYYNTYKIGENSPVSVHENSEMKDFPEGYARIMVVRKSKDYENQAKRENIWDELFGKKENDNEKTKIKNDNILAMPIITERIPVKFK